MYTLWQKPLVRILVIAWLPVLASGCGGESNGANAGGDTTAKETISGLFQGHLVENGEVSGVTAAIARDGTTVYALRDDPNLARTTRLFDGVTTGTDSSVRFSGQILADGARLPISFQSTLESDTLTATLQGGAQLQLQRLARSGQNTSLTKLAGAYAFLGPNGNVWQLTVRADGSVTLTPDSGDCDAQGQVNVPDPAVNVFRVTIPAGACTPFNTELSALGSVDVLPPATRVLRLNGSAGENPVHLNLFTT